MSLHHRQESIWKGSFFPFQNKTLGVGGPNPDRNRLPPRQPEVRHLRWWEAAPGARHIANRPDNGDSPCVNNGRVSCPRATVIRPSTGDAGFSPWGKAGFRTGPSRGGLGATRRRYRVNSVAPAAVGDTGAGWRGGRPPGGGAVPRRCRGNPPGSAGRRSWRSRGGLEPGTDPGPSPAGGPRHGRRAADIRSHPGRQEGRRKSVDAPAPPRKEAEPAGWPPRGPGPYPGPAGHPGAS